MGSPPWSPTLCQHGVKLGWSRSIPCTRRAIRAGYDRPGARIGPPPLAPQEVGLVLDVFSHLVGSAGALMMNNPEAGSTASHVNDWLVPFTRPAAWAEG